MQTSQPVPPSESPNPANDLNPIVQTTEPSTIVPPITNHVDQPLGANPEPKKSSRKLLLLLAVFGIVFILVAVAIVILASRPQNTTPTPTITLTPTVTASIEVSPSVTITGTPSISPTVALMPSDCIDKCSDKEFIENAYNIAGTITSYKMTFVKAIEDSESKGELYSEYDETYKNTSTSPLVQEIKEYRSSNTLYSETFIKDENRYVYDKREEEFTPGVKLSNYYGSYVLFQELKNGKTPSGIATTLKSISASKVVTVDGTKLRKFVLVFSVPMPQIPGLTYDLDVYFNDKGYLVKVEHDGTDLPGYRRENYSEFNQPQNISAKVGNLVNKVEANI